MVPIFRPNAKIVRYPFNMTFSTQTVYRAGRVEGVLRLNVPPVNLGYDRIHAGEGAKETGDAVSIGEGETLSKRTNSYTVDEAGVLMNQVDNSRVGDLERSFGP